MSGNPRYRDIQMASFLNQSESVQMHLVQSNSFNTARYRNCPTHTRTTPCYSLPLILDQSKPFQISILVDNCSVKKELENYVVTDYN